MSVCEISMLTSADIELLGHHLTEEISAQEDVLRRLGEQERFLVKNDVNGLKQFLAESDPMLARLQSLTEMRMRIMGLFAKRLGIPVDSCSVSRVLASIEPDDRERLSEQANVLRNLLKEVDRRTRRVNVLLRHASETNQALLHALLGEHAPLRLYSPDGKRPVTSGLPHFARDF
jgi:flagellar biosynthesis/type III secretory pathway chaperone